MVICPLCMLQDHRKHDVVDVQQVMDEKQVNKEKSSSVNKKNKRHYEKLDKFDELIQKLEESADKMMQDVQDDLDAICGKLTGDVQNINLSSTDDAATANSPEIASLPEPSEENLAALVHEVLGREYTSIPLMQPTDLQIRAEGKMFTLSKVKIGWKI